MKKILIFILLVIATLSGYSQSERVEYFKDSTRSIKITRTIDERVLKVELENFESDTVYINLYSEESCVVESAVVNPGKHHTYKIYIKYIDEYIDLVEVEATNFIATKRF